MYVTQSEWNGEFLFRPWKGSLKCTCRKMLRRKENYLMFIFWNQLFKMLFQIFLWLCEEWGAFKRVINFMQLQKYYFFKKVPSVHRTISVLKLISFGKNYYVWVYLYVCEHVCMCVYTVIFCNRSMVYLYLWWCIR